MFPVSQEVPGMETKGLHEDMLFGPDWVNSSFITKCLNSSEQLLSGSPELWCDISETRPAWTSN